MQAYLLDGIQRWNQNRASDNTARLSGPLLSYNSLLRHAANDLAAKVNQKVASVNQQFNCSVPLHVPEFFPGNPEPKQYTGMSNNKLYFLIICLIIKKIFIKE